MKPFNKTGLLFDIEMGDKPNYKIIDRTNLMLKQYITSILPDNEWVDWYGDKIHISKTEIYDYYDGDIPKETKSEKLAFWVGLVSMLAGIAFGVIVFRYLFNLW